MALSLACLLIRSYLNPLIRTHTLSISQCQADRPYLPISTPEHLTYILLPTVNVYFYWSTFAGLLIPSNHLVCLFACLRVHLHFFLCQLSITFSDGVQGWFALSFSSTWANGIILPWDRPAFFQHSHTLSFLYVHVIPEMALLAILYAYWLNNKTTDSVQIRFHDLCCSLRHLCCDSLLMPFEH